VQKTKTNRNEACKGPCKEALVTWYSDLPKYLEI